MKYEASLENLERALDLVMTEAERIGFKGIPLNRIRLASEEVIVNIIHHAYPKASGDFELDVSGYQERKGIAIRISDEGIAFNPLSHVPTGTLNLPLEQRKIGGLGIHLVVSVMDQLEYKRENGKNILSMAKFLES